MPALCMLLSTILVIVALFHLGPLSDRLSGSMLMVAASVCLLASVTATKSEKPEKPKPAETSKGDN